VQPYDWSQVVTTNGATAVNTIAVMPQNFGFNDLATILMIEVPDGQTIRYELHSHGSALIARSNSSGHAGSDHLEPVVKQNWESTKCHRVLDGVSWEPSLVLALLRFGGSM